MKRKPAIATENLEAIVVSDDSDAAQVLEALFKACGWKVVTHQSGCEATISKASLKAIRGRRKAIEAGKPKRKK